VLSFDAVAFVKVYSTLPAKSELVPSESVLVVYFPNVAVAPVASLAQVNCLSIVPPFATVE